MTASAIDMVRRAKEILDGSEPEDPLYFVFTRSELKALGYDLADTVKPGDVFEWHGNTIIVAGRELEW